MAFNFRKQETEESEPKKSRKDISLMDADEREETFQDEIKKIVDIMKYPPYAEYLIDATSNKAHLDKIYETILNDPSFSMFFSHGNEKIARIYANEVGGLGIIQRLIDAQAQSNGERITDIGFNSNGYLTVETNKSKFTYGNHKGEPKVSAEYITRLVERLCQQEGSDGKAFNKNTPLFNGANEVSLSGDGKTFLRISANEVSTSPYGTTLSIRLSSPYLALTRDNFNSVAPMNQKLDTYNLLKILVECHCNIIISAETGAGKTELQKMLTGFIPFHDRIIMIEDTQETRLPELYPTKDIFSWLTVEGKITITDLLKQALRNDPKWIIVAETRGSEAYEMFQGVKSGHFIITTMHSISNEAVPARFYGMASTEYALNEQSTERDFLNYMHIGIHLRKRDLENGSVIRYIDEIAEFVPVSDKHPNGINVLFHQHVSAKGVREVWTGRPSEYLQDKIYSERDSYLSEQEWKEYPKEEMLKDRIF